jgi:glucose-1-phosphate cytidylyltransferase
MQVVILCGGKGTRSYPYTEYFPKAMMPIGGTPIIVHLMRNFAAQGFNRFVLAAGHRQEILRDYFDRGFADYEVKIVDTGGEADTGERIFACREHLSGRFCATYGDGISDLDVNALISFHEQSRGLATLTSVPLRVQYGTVDLDGSHRVRRFDEKPVIRDRFINAGFIVFEPEVFECWRGTSLERDVLPALSARGELFAYLHEGFWQSMDTSKDQQELEKLLHNGTVPWIWKSALAVGCK